MIVSYPLVDDNGVENGAEVSCKFKEIFGLQHMTKWDYRREAPDGPREEVHVIVAGCCTLYVGRQEFNVKADYAQVLAKLKEYNEMYE